MELLLQKQNSAVTFSDVWPILLLIQGAVENGEGLGGHVEARLGKRITSLCHSNSHQYPREAAGFF